MLIFYCDHHEYMCNLSALNSWSDGLVTDLLRISGQVYRALLHRGRDLANLAAGMAGRKGRRKPVFAAAALIACSLAAPAAWSDEATDCWQRFFRDRGVAEPVGEIVAVAFVGQTFRVPAAYLWRGVPRQALGDQDAVWLLALAPNLSPPNAAQVRDYWRPSSPTIRVTVFGHPRFLHGRALLDAFVAPPWRASLSDERDVNGFTVLRPPRWSNYAWGEIHVSPEGPDELFNCYPDGVFPHPLCTAHRWIGGSIRLQMEFRKHLIPHYRILSGSLADFMRCALGPAGIPGQVWPPSLR